MEQIEGREREEGDPLVDRLPRCAARVAEQLGGPGLEAGGVAVREGEESEQPAGRRRR